MKCKADTTIANPRRMVMKNGRPATGGECPHCGTRLYVIGWEKAMQVRK